MGMLQWGERISSDDDVVDRFLHEGMKVTSPSVTDLVSAIEWLALYGAESVEDAQPFANVIAHLERVAATKERRAEIARQKRVFAQYMGVPVSSVRIYGNEGK